MVKLSTCQAKFQSSYMLKIVQAKTQSFTWNKGNSYMTYDYKAGLNEFCQNLK